MRKHLSVRDGIAALVVLVGLALVLAPRANAKVPPSLRGPVAVVGERKVEAIDIQRAAQALGVTPPAGMTARAWRRTLLDRCVDRELLAAEAERRGLDDDPEVHRDITSREFSLLWNRVYEEDLVPNVRPTRAEVDSIRKTGRYRYVDLYYILLRDDAGQGRRELARKIVQRARDGGRWDSLSRFYSGHPPSAAAGGHLGMILVKEIEPASQDSVAFSPIGRVYGPYYGQWGHEIYKVGGFYDMTDDSLTRLLTEERTAAIYENYWNRVLKKYNFKVDSLNAARAIHIIATETPDSILASLGPDGTRPSLGVRTGVGIIARAEGEAVTLADIIRIGRTIVDGEERGRFFVDPHYLEMAAARVILQNLIVRDIRDRGMDQGEDIVRKLRLARDQAMTLALVRRARPADPTPQALAAYIQKNAARYRRPAMRLASVAMYANVDSARAALRSWNGVGFPSDSTLLAMGFRPRRPYAGAAGVDLSNLYPQQFGTVALAETSTDPLAMTLRALAPGQFAPVTAVTQGYAVAMMTGKLDPAPMSETEVAPIALRDWREEMENQWVTDQLERLRATTPVSVFPNRLEAVKIAPPPQGGPSKRRTAS